MECPALPFPQRAQKLHFNIPFTDAVEQIPQNVKFMKEVLSKIRRLGDFETVVLTESSNAALSLKLKDPGSFTIPCTIGSTFFRKASCDLGPSINLMPFSVYKELGLGEVKPTSVSL
ncbi:hypothetical protein MLD38_000001 [Melastoma candidum]|uniref:Uncharacterized protein n=1 Tax=Melastoma candidum TaxID=119954 RepID=A0ACB9SCL8_9MYRT|nr:hypothetical protein MLD38_000001 [Melastoma candidum]